MENNILKEYIERNFFAQAEILSETEENMTILADKKIYKEIAEYIKNLGYTFLADITSTDNKDCFMVICQFFRYTKNENITLKIKIEDRVNPEIDSLAGLWATADWHEREVYDLMGINFKGHPNLKRILMWEGYKGHPLRKDFPAVTRKRSWELG
ncbi:MAG: NADH-quinone oxidoreductase subunit C [Eubacteriales bacterium]|jgi:NADH-quinone oxidoreductase subunit C|nr:NADH-quinone oxidoreductase subunit C [Eubacteriales bacterium]NCC80760.1 NADH-quinone oxidoreductase subunit C [Clostridia bacterium]